MKKNIAVIMTVHNRRDTTVECIRRFYQCRSIETYDVDFYMMDDGSTDGTSEAVAATFPQVIILKGDGNLFWNRGMYYCWKEAIKKEHDYYLWLNDDTMLFETAIETLFKDYNDAGALSIISGCCCDTETRSVTTYGGADEKWKLIPMDKTRQLTYAMNGNCVLIPQNVVKKIGILDPFFLHSMGDNEYSMRGVSKDVLTYISSGFVGTCDRHDCLPKNMNPNYSLKERLKYLNTPFGSMPKERYYLFRKYKGVVYALKDYLWVIYRTIIIK